MDFIEKNIPLEMRTSFIRAMGPFPDSLSFHFFFQVLWKSSPMKIIWEADLISKELKQ